LRVLVVNAGSSTLKLALVEEAERTIEARELQAPRGEANVEELSAALSSTLGEADAVGHRIVHGGERYRQAVRMDERVERDLRALADLAPLHQQRSLAALDAVSGALPNIPAAACFDTAFHATLSPAAYTYALPAEWRERWGLRRYGFHGLSHAWIARRTPQLMSREPGDIRIVSAHLGAGASLCAISGGRSVDTTMGFTPLEGLVMATRSGSVDPGMLIWILEHHELIAHELAEALEHDSGLLGLSGSADMREVLDRDLAGDQRAGLALDTYVHRLRCGIAAMAGALGGLDALVFTGGVGERSPEVRERTCSALGFLGVAIDPALNEAAHADALISADRAAAAVLVVGAREDLEIARQVRAVIAQ
jgi:acetate kinase